MLANLSKRIRQLLRSRWLHVLLSLFLCGLSVGYFLGRALSPTYEDPTNSPLFIREYVARVAFPEYDVSFLRHAARLPSGKPKDPRAYQEYTAQRDGRGRVLAVSRAPERLRYACGTTTFIWDCPGRSLTRSSAPLDERTLMTPPPRGLSGMDAVLFLAGGSLQAYQVRNVWPAVAKYVSSAPAKAGPLRRYIYASISLLGGIAAGVYLGYENSPRCGERVFQAELEKPEFWDGVATAYRELNTWRLIYDDFGHISVDVKVGPPSWEVDWRFGRGGYYALLDGLERTGAPQIAAELRRTLGHL